MFYKKEYKFETNLSENFSTIVKCVKNNIGAFIKTFLILLHCVLCLFLLTKILPYINICSHASRAGPYFKALNDTNYTDIYEDTHKLCFSTQQSVNFYSYFQSKYWVSNFITAGSFSIIAIYSRTFR
jgi:hypothetical protein